MTNHGEKKIISFRPTDEDREIMEEYKKVEGGNIRKITDADCIRQGLQLIQKGFTNPYKNKDSTSREAYNHNVIQNGNNVLELPLMQSGNTGGETATENSYFPNDEKKEYTNMLNMSEELNKKEDVPETLHPPGMLTQEYDGVDELPE